MRSKFFFLLLIGWVYGNTLFAQDCTLKKVKDGISVYTCESKESKRKSIRATLTLKGKTLQELVTLLDNIDDYKNWQYKMIESSILQRINDREVIYRTVVEAPWPAANRELIVHKKVTMDTEAHTLTIVVEDSDYPYPEDSDLVRVPYQVATWKVTAVNNDLKVDYTLDVDLGGSIPAWIVNLGIAEGPFHSFGKLKKKLGI
jgi:START domain